VHSKLGAWLFKPMAIQTYQHVIYINRLVYGGLGLRFSVAEWLSSY
jgi:hypothetical protein